MNIKAIAQQVAYFLQKERADFVLGDGTDMLIATLNHCRKAAERDYWYGNQMAEAWVSVDPTDGGSLDQAFLMDDTPFGSTSCRVKGVQTAYLGDDTDPGSFKPIYVDSKKLRMIKQREQCWGYAQTEEMYYRYPGDYVRQGQRNAYSNIFLGRKIMFAPPFSTTKKLGLDAQLWMDDYAQDRMLVALATDSGPGGTDVTLSQAAPLNVVVGTSFLGTTITNVDVTRLQITLLSNSSTAIATPTWVSYSNGPGVSSIGNAGEDYENWFTIHGADYLVFAAICHLNLATNTFAPRTEGFNPAPEKARDKALMDVRTYDTFEWEGGRIAMRNR